MGGGGGTQDENDSARAEERLRGRERKAFFSAKVFRSRFSELWVVSGGGGRKKEFYRSGDE